MFRKINVNNTREELKFHLYKNRYEEIFEIPYEWIGKIKRNLEEVDSFDIEIPKYITRGTKKINNPIYSQIKPTQQIVLETNVGDNISFERFTVLEKNLNSNKNKGVKKFTAYSFEKTIERYRVKLENEVLQLKTDNIHIAKGILDRFEEQTKWKLEYCDPKSRTEVMQCMEVVNDILFKKLTLNKVEKEKLIFEKAIATNVKEEKPLFLSIEYSNLKTYSIDDRDKLLKTENIINNITEALHENIINVKAYHHSEAGNRYGIKYIFTLKTGEEVERISTFTNVLDKKITCDEIKLVWETGNIIEKENVKYINVDSVDDNWYKYINEVLEQFNSLILFNSYNKTFSVIHRDNVGKDNGGLLLGYDESILNLNITESSMYPTGLRVRGKDETVSIIEENMYGDDIIYNYDYYIRNDIISESLKTALSKYDETLIIYQDTWKTLKDLKMDITQRKTKIDSEIKSLEDRIKNLKNILVSYMGSQEYEDHQKRLKLEIEELENRLNECLLLRTDFMKQLEEVDDEIIEIASQIKADTICDKYGNKIFTEENISEKDDIEWIEPYQDEYYSIAYSLLKHSKNVLKEKTTPEVDFKIDCPNLIKLINNRDWRGVLALGDVFTFSSNEIIDELGLDSVRFVGYEYEVKENKISNLMFVNKIKKIEKNKTITNIGKQTNSNTQVMNNFKKVWEDSLITNNFVGNLIDGVLDTSATAIRSRSMSNLIDISEAGIFLYNNKNLDECIYIGSSMICLSKDGFKTSDTCIDSNGVIGQTVIGRLILGSKLLIQSEDGSFYVGNDDNEEGKFGVTIADDLAKERIFLGVSVDKVTGLKTAKLRLTSKDGKQMILSEDGIVSHQQFTDRDLVDKGSSFKTYYRIPEGVDRLDEIRLFIKFDTFKSYSKGSGAGGGNVSTTVSGGGSVSDASGSGSVTSTSGGNINMEVFTGNGTFENHEATIRVATPPDYLEDGKTHGHVMATNQIKHTHAVIIRSENHSHTVNVPSHTHNTPDHNHSLTLGDHTHENILGCYDTTYMPSDAKVIINGQVAYSNLNTDCDLNITRFLKLNHVNTIEITSETKGKFIVSLYGKQFARF